MKFNKKHLCDLPSCYAASQMEQDGRRKLLFAPDAYGPCYSFDSETFQRETVWEAPSGTMSMIPVPGRQSEFLAVQLFNPGFQAQDAKIVYAQCKDSKWQVKTLFKLPYVHRFGILQRAGITYILCCTLCTTKKDEQDWSSPGGVYAAELPNDLTQPITLAQIAGSMNRNHGYWPFKKDGYRAALTSCDQGVFEFSPPAQRGDNWTIRNILAKPVSDIASADIDGDGVDELAAIEPFHGSEIVIYHKDAEGYVSIYRHPQELDFCHVIWGGRLRGEATFIGGCRGGDQELFLLRMINSQIQSEIIETGGGPSNITVISGSKSDLIGVANRGIGEGAVFMVMDA